MKMKAVRVPKGSHTTKMCYECGKTPATHRLTGCRFTHGYCLKCAKKIAERENERENMEMSEGEYQATRW